MALLCVVTACSTGKFVPDGEYLLDDVSVVTDNKRLKSSDLRAYVRQNPNSRWFSKVKVPLRIYSLAGRDSLQWINKVLKRLGEKPVLFDEGLAERSEKDIRQAVMNKGYMSAQVSLEKQIHKKKLKAVYHVHSGPLYRVSSIRCRVDDPELETIILQDSAATLLRPNMPFDANVLNSERVRISNNLLDLGYYKFNKDYITFRADTCRGTCLVDLTLRVRNAANHSHTRYSVGNVHLLTSTSLNRLLEGERTQFDSIHYDGCQIYFQDKLHFRPRILSDNVLMSLGRIYRQSDVLKTYENFNRMKAFRYTHIRFLEDPADSTLLNCMILTDHNKANSISAELEGTNSAGDLGAAASVSYSHRNLFRGSELFTVKLRGAYEAITGLEGYSNQNYVEWGAEASLNFPRFLCPFLSRDFRRGVKASSEVAIQYDMQNRPEFRRRVASLSWRYRWNKQDKKTTHKLDVLDLSYIYMPWISRTFKEQYLDNLDNYNAILKYNYEDLFIMKAGYSLVYNSQGITGGTGSNFGTNSYTIRANVETAGNLLHGLSRLCGAVPNKEGRYTFINIAYAQYVKGDFDFSKSFLFDRRNSMAFHVGLGVAYPYGNSQILPFEKRYFSGGANSVRGWSVRTLGPGSYSGGSRDIDYINQSGDIRLDVNLEFRTQLFWKVNGALFIDAGNIWTLRRYDDQPGGQFRWNEFYKQIAVAYGVGFRFVFDYFILRFDGGMKALNPVYESGRDRYPLLHPNFSRDFAFHFAVGLPF